MKQLIALLALVSVATAEAAGFYGSVTVDGHLPTTDMPIDVVCRGQSVASGTVNTRGLYRVFAQNGALTSCEVRIENASAPVVVYPNPTRYDFALTHSGGRANLVQR